MKKIAIIKAGGTNKDIVDRYGDFEKWIIDRIGIDKNNIIVSDIKNGEPFPDFNNISGAVITGSHSMVTEKQEWSLKIEEWIRGAFNNDIYLLGICYGHQLIAEALGGKVDYNSNGKEYGTKEIIKEDDDIIFKNLPSTFKAHECHSQSVIKLPTNAKLLAKNSHDPHQAFSINDKIWGVQFHPEFNEEHMKTYIDAFEENLIKDGHDTDILRSSVEMTNESTSILRYFAEIALSNK